MNRQHRLIVLGLVLLLLSATAAGMGLGHSAPDIDLFFRAGFSSDANAEAALSKIAGDWRVGYTAMVLEMAEIIGRTQSPDSPASVRYSRLISFLTKETGESFGDDLDGWHRWIWNHPYDPPAGYATFKGRLYGMLDPRFKAFFREPLRSSIRLDEIEWGGVAVNGIPPLDHPRTVSAANAGYLQEDNIVFGIYSHGVARAYPKRILAWHELALDRVGDLDLTIVYCTLCGTVIPYESRVGGVVRTFGTSGFLYRSNKLMFDAETHSLWSSLDGTPVVGPLVGSGLHLSLLPVVTTTWGEWRREHPDTTVLSIDTGFTRDYSEGRAYREYFANDDLMFQVPKTDKRLKNKDEVLVLRPTFEVREDGAPVAISTKFLNAHRVYELDIAGRRLVVVTTAAGANRVYDSGSYRFLPSKTDNELVDANGNQWAITEDALRSLRDPALQLPRIPAHRSFWFVGMQHPDTHLIK